MRSGAHEVFFKQLLVFNAQRPQPVVMRHCTQVHVEQNASSVVSITSDQRESELHGNMPPGVHDKDLRLLGRNYPEPAPA